MSNLEKMTSMVVSQVDGEVISTESFGGHGALIGRVTATLTNGKEEVTILIPPNSMQVGDDYDVTVRLELKQD